MTSRQPIDGTVSPRRRRISPATSDHPTRTLQHVKVDPALWAEVQRLHDQQPHRRIVIVSATEVWLR